MKNICYATALLLAYGVTLVGCTAAATSPTTATPATTKAMSTPNSPPGLTHVTAYSVNTDNPVFASVISGPAISDFGPAEETAPGSTDSSAHGGELVLRLTHGAFRLNIASLGTLFLEGTSHEPIFPQTCSTYVSASHNVPIVPGSGIGSYRGISGSFAMTLTVNEVHTSPCTKSLTILRQVIVLSGAGRIKLGH